MTWQDMMRELLGDELDAFLRAEDEPPALALRINPLRPNAFSLAEPFCENAVPWCETGYYLKENVRPGTTRVHDLGAFYLQEASAMASAAVLDAKPGEKILDLCAAPGGKSTQIAGSMMGQGLLVSNEPVPSRAKILAENLERMGVVNAVAVSAYPDHLAKKWPETFDGILVDAPCSGEGMFRRDPNARAEWDEGSPMGCARRQADILDEAAKMLAVGGRLVYSTCTFNRYEDEGSIEGFLTRHPEFEIENFTLEGVGTSEGGCLRLWPHKVRGDGHFVAKLRKMDSAGRIPKAKKRTNQKKTEDSTSYLARLEDETVLLPDVLRAGTLIRQGDYIHLLPEGTPDLDTVRTFKPGLCLMRVGRSHVQPAPALARASLPMQDQVAWMAAARRSLALDAEGIGRYERGERFASDEKGWTLLTHEGLPMGWTKVIETA